MKMNLLSFTWISMAKAGFYLVYSGFYSFYSPGETAVFWKSVVMIRKSLEGVGHPFGGR